MTASNGQTDTLHEEAGSERPRPERRHLAEAVWRHLGGILRGLSRPTEAEIQADTYDGSVPISQWLEQNSK